MTNRMTEESEPVEDTGLSGALEIAVRRLAGTLSGSVMPDGAVRGICASRIFESALTLQLLREEEAYPNRQQRIAGFLWSAHITGAVSVFDEALVEGVMLGRREADAEKVLDVFLGRYDHFTAARKKVMFEICLAVVRAAPYPAHLSPGAIVESESDAPWVKLILRSLRVLLAHGLGRQADIDRSEADSLLNALSAGQRDSVWENHVTAHVIGLLAASRIAPGSRPVREGIAQLLRVQNPDGGIPSIASLDPFCTGPAGLALARSGVADPELLTAMGDYLVSRQAADGGWGFGEGTRQTDVDTSAYAANFLRLLDTGRYRSALTAARAYFEGMANRDGGFATYVRDHDSEIAMTAGAARALAAPDHRHDVLRAATGFLLGAQKPDGTFECSWTLSEANAIWRTVWALDSVPECCCADEDGRRRDEVVARALGRLARTQNEDGGWGHRPDHPSDVTSTAYSVLAFTDGGAGGEHRAVLERAAEHLLRRQSPTGRYSAPPDQVAPRPVLFDVPVFTDIWVLTALSGLRRALADGVA
ncbi:hypothetical protein [Streptomyces sp. NPDC055607]